LNPNLESLATLQQKYQSPTFSSVEELFSTDLAASIDGAIVCTPHATHAKIGSFLLDQAMKRRQQSPSSSSSSSSTSFKPLNILMEKPMTTNIREAKEMHDLVRQATTTSRSSFLINHSANYIPQTKAARELVKAGEIGDIKHITGAFSSPLSWIFDDPAQRNWNELVCSETSDILPSGFAWGQSSHILAWIYHVAGDEIQPQRVFCTMNHSPITGADVSHAATIQCNNENEVTFGLSGTSLLPGNAHSAVPVAKEIRIKIYGTKGAILYTGNDRDPSSGRLELRVGGKDAGIHEGAIQVQCEELGFEFEDLDPEGIGPQSLQSFIAACLRETSSGVNFYVGADSLVGLKTVQTLDAMYRSDRSGKLEEVMFAP
jgi:predicted dehydrogenase